MISINFNLATRQASEYEQCAEELFQQHNRLKNIITEVRGAWKGETSAMYIRKLEVFRSQLNDEATKLRRDATAFRAKIEELRRLDEEAAAAMAEMANNR